MPKTRQYADFFAQCALFHSAVESLYSLFVIISIIPCCFQKQVFQHVVKKSTIFSLKAAPAAQNLYASRASPHKTPVRLALFSLFNVSKVNWSLRTLPVQRPEQIRSLLWSRGLKKTVDAPRACDMKPGRRFSTYKKRRPPLKRTALRRPGALMSAVFRRLWRQGCYESELKTVPLPRYAPESTSWEKL